MNILIYIPEEEYGYLKQQDEEGYVSRNEKRILNGTPIPDNATNGDVIRALFKPNWIRRMDDVVREEYEFDAVWWNAPYQKGGKE